MLALHTYSIDLGSNALIGLLAICATMVYLAHSATVRSRHPGPPGKV